jgi:hypothetical protein
MLSELIPHQIGITMVFEDRAVDAVADAFGEKIQEQRYQGEVDTIDPYDQEIASWSGKKKHYYAADSIDIVDRLTGYVDDTNFQLDILGDPMNEIVRAAIVRRHELKQVAEKILFSIQAQLEIVKLIEGIV